MSVRKMVQNYYVLSIFPPKAWLFFASRVTSYSMLAFDHENLANILNMSTFVYYFSAFLVH